MEAAETEGRLIYDLGNRQWDIPALRELLERIIPRDEAIEGYEIEHDFEGIGRRALLLNARKIHRPENDATSLLLAIDDSLTGRWTRRAEVKHSVDKPRAVRRPPGEKRVVAAIPMAHATELDNLAAMAKP